MARQTARPDHKGSSTHSDTSERTPLTPLRTFRLDKADLGAGLDTHPELLASLEALAQSVVAATRSSTEATQQAASSDTGRVGATLRNFLEMLGARDAKLTPLR